MEKKRFDIKIIVQRRILFFSVLIFAAKIAAYFITNSVGVLTDALESIVNVTTGVLSLVSISISIKPKDHDHPFGHGKVESLSASVEGLMIILAGCFIIFEAIKRLFIPADIHQLDTGIIIVAVAGGLNYILGYYSIRTGKRHNSIALMAGGKHLQSDTYSTIGLVTGLIILMLTKKVWLDSVIALIFGSIIIITGIRILQTTIANLMDEADIRHLEKIVSIINDNREDEWIEIHNIRIVKYGDFHHMDCDLTLPWYLNILDAHSRSDLLKKAIAENYPIAIDMTVHADACHPGLCRYCSVSSCEYRQQEHDSELEWTVEKMTLRDPQIARAK